MLTPTTISNLILKINNKYSKATFGVHSPHKKITNYIYKQIHEINLDDHQSDLEKITKMINLLEGFSRYLQDYNPILQVEVDKILTFIYYPDSEENTLKNKDNLLLGSKGQTVRIWHDAYYENNRGPIINRFIDCKSLVYRRNRYDYLKQTGAGMPDQMQKGYIKMFDEQEKANFKPKKPASDKPSSG